MPLYFVGHAQKLKQFKTKNITILVATDVASRGIDVDDISHVIHYQLPDDNEVYTHRSGRTGRAGKEGTSIALVGGRDKYKLVQIEKTIKCRMERKMVPSGEEVMKAMVFQSMENLINAQVHPKALKPFTEAIHELSEQMTVTEVLEKFIALNSSKILNFYKDAKDLNASGKSGRDKKSRDSQRIFINIGEKDGFDWATLKDLLREKTSLTNDDFGGVDVKGAFSFFNVSKSTLAFEANLFNSLFTSALLNLRVSYFSTSICFSVLCMFAFIAAASKLFAFSWEKFSPFKIKIALISFTISALVIALFPIVANRASWSAALDPTEKNNDSIII